MCIHISVLICSLFASIKEVCETFILGYLKAKGRLSRLFSKQILWVKRCNAWAITVDFSWIKLSLIQHWYNMLNWAKATMNTLPGKIKLSNAFLWYFWKFDVTKHEFMFSQLFLCNGTTARAKPWRSRITQWMGWSRTWFNLHWLPGNLSRYTWNYWINNNMHTFDLPFAFLIYRILPAVEMFTQVRKLILFGLFLFFGKILSRIGLLNCRRITAMVAGGAGWGIWQQPEGNRPFTSRVS